MTSQCSPFVRWRAGKMHSHQAARRGMPLRWVNVAMEESMKNPLGGASSEA